MDPFLNLRHTDPGIGVRVADVVKVLALVVDIAPVGV